MFKIIFCSLYERSTYIRYEKKHDFTAKQRDALNRTWNIWLAGQSATQGVAVLTRYACNIGDSTSDADDEKFEVGKNNG